MFKKLADNLLNTFYCALNESRQEYRLIALLLFLSFVPLAPNVLGYGAIPLRIDVYSLYWVFGLALLALASRHLFFVIGFCLAPANLIYLHVTHHWGPRQFQARIEAALESPTSEILEYLQSHLDIDDYGIILFSILYFVLLFRAATRLHNHPKALARIAGVALVVWALVLVGYHDSRPVRILPQLTLVPDAFKARIRYRQLEGRRQFLAQHPIPIRECKSKYDKIVIAFGEAALSDHMSIFGYPKDTTPFAVQSRPYAFDALAPSNQTRYSIPMLLTSAIPGHFEVFYREHSLVGQLRACGFRTLWISNHQRRGKHDSNTTSLAMEAHEHIFLNELSIEEGHYDEQIVEALDSRNIWNRRKHATFVHLIGSHVAYGKRFPENFGFTESTGTVSDYDNSLLYSDLVLSKLYNKFYDESLLFVYVSDHGEVVSSTTFGHGFAPAYKQEYRVPLLIWTNDAAAIEQIKSASGKARINTESLDDIVRFLVGISTSPGVSTSRSVSVLAPENVQQYDDLRSFGVD